MSRPDLAFDLVRPGLALYGLSPLPDVTPAELGLRPAMTLRARVALVKTAPAGHGVSYGHIYHTAADTALYEAKNSGRDRVLRCGEQSAAA